MMMSSLFMTSLSRKASVITYKHSATQLYPKSNEVQMKPLTFDNIQFVTALPKRLMVDSR